MKAKPVGQVLPDLHENIINDAITGRNGMSVEESFIKATLKVRGPVVVQYAAYLKYSYGGCLHGMSDLDWLNSAREQINLLQVLQRKQRKVAKK